MAEPKWMSFAEASPEREYLALMSYLPLKKFRMIPRFIRYTREIQTQLKQAKGLVGYSLQAKLLRREFWTLSVWEDENALMEFVHSLPHSHVMVALSPHMGKTNFVRWKISGSVVPPTWEEALRREQTE
jgi:hypothetical protein